MSEEVAPVVVVAIEISDPALADRLASLLGGNHDRQRAEIRNDGRKHGRRSIPGIEPQQRDVGGVIAPRDAGRTHRSVGKLDRDFAFVGQCLVGRHDQTGFPDEAGGPRAVRVHRDDRGFCPGNDIGKGGG